jgi:hypothetical protein
VFEAQVALEKRICIGYLLRGTTNALPTNLVDGFVASLGSFAVWLARLLPLNHEVT